MDSFQQAAALLPPELGARAGALPGHIRSRAEELRLRAGRRPTVTVEGAELPLPGEAPVTLGELELTVELATRHSAHTALERVRQGYVTVRGGHRLGLCGTAVVEEGRVKNLRRLSSVALRIAHAVPGCGEGPLRALGGVEAFPDTLILAPPGGGKTTLLRDLVRLLSLGGARVGLCDERGEVAALWEGVPQFDVGPHTDVLEGCPKGEGLLMLLRGMAPRVLCCDEITHPDDLAALEVCANCGVGLLATVHARSVAELAGRPLWREAVARGLFRQAVVIGAGRRYRVEGLPCGG